MDGEEWDDPGVNVESRVLLQVKDMEEGVRNAVGTRLLQLTLRELFNWRFMQTDPNWCAEPSRPSSLTNHV